MAPDDIVIVRDGILFVVCANRPRIIFLALAVIDCISLSVDQSTWLDRKVGISLSKRLTVKSSDMSFYVDYANRWRYSDRCVRHF